MKGWNGKVVKAWKRKVVKMVYNREDDVLTSKQLQYAARDALASLIIYHKFQILEMPQPLPPGSLTSLTPVFLYSTDNTTVITQGQIAVNHLLKPSYDTINITPT